SGNVVALDATDALLRRISGAQLTIKLSRGELPEDLAPLMLAPTQQLSDQTYTLRITDYAQVEPILRSLREGGAVINDMQLQRADLEDVFIQITGSTQ